VCIFAYENIPCKDNVTQIFAKGVSNFIAIRSQFQNSVRREAFVIDRVQIFQGRPDKCCSIRVHLKLTVTNFFYRVSYSLPFY
jgi:hypothetical protein